MFYLQYAKILIFCKICFRLNTYADGVFLMFEPLVLQQAVQKIFPNTLFVSIPEEILFAPTITTALLTVILF